MVGFFVAVSITNSFFNEGRKCLGKEFEESQKKKRLLEVQVVKAKRRKLEEEHLKGDFKSRMRGNFMEKQILADLYKSQKACHHLDLQKVINEIFLCTFSRVLIEV